MRLRLLFAVVVVAALNTGSAAVAAPKEPPLRLVAPASSVTVTRWEPGEPVWLDYGVHMVAGKKPWEVRAKRAAYTEPIVAHQVVRGAGGKQEVPLPAGLINDFYGLTDFAHVTLTDGGGNVVLDRDEDFCPGWRTTRTRPDAPDTSPYPEWCNGNPFSLGMVWGIQAGWSTQLVGILGEPVDLPDGSYQAQIRVNERYRDVFGIPADQSSATVTLVIRTETDEEHGDEPAPRAAVGPAQGPGPQPAASRPAGKGSVPKGPKPDLRSLPAWGIQTGGFGAVEGRDHLSFNATVWTGGNSPLVVDGFRRAGEDLMDAYQYFYDAKGNQTGYAQVGTMEWDARDGHEHWHFTDFAQYRLLDSTMELAVRSGKEAFCLANTDAVDYTLPRANWRPENTDLHTSCGDGSSIAVRQVLDVGSGDTYAQYLPGQSFDITDLPNGTYYIEVVANPDGNLYESDRTNNSSLRQVILGGEPGARTVEVPPVGDIAG